MRSARPCQVKLIPIKYESKVRARSFEWNYSIEKKIKEKGYCTESENGEVKFSLGKTAAKIQS